MISYLQIDKLTKSFGDLVLFEDITFGIAQGQKVGLIAKNGTGKTTLLNIIAGKEDYDSGAVVFRNDLRVGYLEQMPHYPDGLTVLQACFYSPNETVRLIAEYEQAMASGDHSNLEDILLRMDNLKAWDYEQRTKQILGQLKIHNFDQKMETLSGGQLKRVALANVLITDPELIILDEPTNHLDLEMTEWLEGYLSRANISILMVTHDRYFLDRVCSEIIEIDRKQIYQYKGNYSYYLEKRQERMDALNAEVDRASNLLRKELDWMRRQPQARGTKAKYRIDAFYELEKKAKQQHEAGNVNLDVKASYIGSKIFEAEHVSKRFGDLKIVEDFNYIFARYEKMGIVGNNGTGKSTFIKMLMGEVEPDSGRFDVGETVRFGYYSQDGLQFDEQMKVIDVVQNIAEYVDLGDGKKMGVSQFLNYFLKMTTPPIGRNSSEGIIDPVTEPFSAFVFKIQANMNKAHSDRIAFMRICSGKFEAGMEVTHVQGGRKIRLSQPQQMMAQDRKIVEEAYAGDIIGVFDPGIFSIGDTLCTGEKVEFEGIPTFAPEHFARVRQMDTMKRKQFIKGISQIAQEGAIQIFQEFNTGMEEIIVGVVGVLQFEVLTYRLENEYNVEVKLEKLPYEYIRWVENADEIDVAKIQGTSDMKRIKDLKDNPLLLFVNSWSVGMVEERNPKLKLSEFGRN